MHVRNHAIRRYKQRFGTKRMSAEKVKREIRKEMEKNLVTIMPCYYAPGKMYVCRNMIIIADGSNVITIHDGSEMPPHVRKLMSTPA